MKMKMVSILGIVLVIGAGVTMGALIANWFFQGSTTVNTTAVLQYSEDNTNWQSAEDLMKNWALENFVGNDVDTQIFYLKCNPNLDNSFQATFNISDNSTDDPEGININLSYNNSGNWVSLIDWDATYNGYSTVTYTFNPGDDIEFKLTFTGDIYLKEGNHEFALTVE